MVRRSTDPGLNQRDLNVLKILERWGWFVTKVGASDSVPTFAYSMGLYENLNHPEIILFGLALELMHGLINDAAKRIQEGRKYEEGHRYDDLIEGRLCAFRQVLPSRYKGFLNGTIWYYNGSSFPAFQLVWADRTGLFPWEVGFDANLAQRQPALYQAKI
jgi:hypothetical protein